MYIRHILVNLLNLNWFKLKTRNLKNLLRILLGFYNNLNLISIPIPMHISLPIKLYNN